MRGLTVEKDGQPIAIAGVLHTSPPQLFSSTTEEIRKSPKTIVKLGHQLALLLEHYKCSVYALADTHIEASDRFLKYLGFLFVGDTSQGRLYQWKHYPSS